MRKMIAFLSILALSGIGVAIYGYTRTKSQAPIAKPIEFYKETPEIPADLKSLVSRVKSSYGKIIKQKSLEFNIPEEYIYYVIIRESRGNPKASRYEAHIKSWSVGLMQILPKTAKNLGYNGGIGNKVLLSGLYSPEINIHYGTKLLADEYKYFKHFAPVVAAYNIGRGKSKIFWDKSGHNLNKFIAELKKRDTHITSLMRKKGYKNFIARTSVYVSEAFVNPNKLEQISYLV